MMEIIVRKPIAEEIETATAWPIWEKEESTFPWEYTQSETCIITEGNATVISETGQTVSFSKGDIVIFPKGLKCTWKIKKKMRKYYKFS